MQMCNLACRTSSFEHRRFGRRIEVRSHPSLTEHMPSPAFPAIQMTSLGHVSNTMLTTSRVFVPGFPPLLPHNQQAAKFLDRSTVFAGRYFFRHPIARLGLLLYLVGS